MSIDVIISTRILFAAAFISTVGGTLLFLARKGYQEYRISFVEPSIMKNSPSIQAALEAEFESITNMQRVTIPSIFHGEERKISAYYLSPMNQKLVLLLHGSGADKTQLLPEVNFLAQAGFGILAIDLPGHGKSDGPITWGSSERGAVEDTLKWALQRQKEEPSRIGAIGILGFSMGSWYALDLAAHEPSIQAVVATGSFPDAERSFELIQGRLGYLGSLPARAVDLFMGSDYYRRTPRENIALISPRPVLIIAGEKDYGFPPPIAQKLYEAALEPKEFWVVPGAGHGNYSLAAPKEYPERVTQFFEQMLPRNICNTNNSEDECIGE